MKSPNAILGICVVAAVAFAATKFYRHQRDLSRAEAISETRAANQNSIQQFSPQQKANYTACLEQVDENYKRRWAERCAPKTGPWIENSSTKPEPGNSLLILQTKKDPTFIYDNEEERKLCSLQSADIEPIKKNKMEESKICERILGRTP